MTAPDLSPAERATAARFDAAPDGLLDEAPSAVDTLREAARVMRERAECATSGRWKSWGMEVRADIDGTSNLDTSLPVASTYSTNTEGRLRTFDADHIIGMQPAVALTVADWLDAEAATRGQMEPFADLINAAISRKGGPESFIRFGRNKDGEVAMVTDTLNAALTVARTYLGQPDAAPDALTCPHGEACTDQTPCTDCPAEAGS